MEESSIRFVYIVRLKSTNQFQNLLAKQFEMSIVIFSSDHGTVVQVSKEGSTSFTFFNSLVQSIERTCPSDSLSCG